MVGTVRLVFLRPTAEFGVGHDQRVVPASQFAEATPAGHQTVRQLPEQAGVRCGLVLVRIEAVQRQPQCRDTAALRDDLAGLPHGIAEGTCGKLVVNCGCRRCGRRPPRHRSRP